MLSDHMTHMLKQGRNVCISVCVEPVAVITLEQLSVNGVVSRGSVDLGLQAMNVRRMLENL